jgi:heme/copper-type cytochrome/quinol oxidase subunit 2
MQTKGKKLDTGLTLLLFVIIAGLPLGINILDRHFQPPEVSSNARVFTLTGHARQGWIIDEVQAHDVVSLWRKNRQPADKPRLEVSRGDLVVFKLRSSDVVHGFSLKDFGIIITDGIEPGKTRYVSFVADRAGTFTFSCNAICGDNHQVMQGTLVVKA